MKDDRIDTSMPSASGTRLKQRIRKTADGAEVFLGWRDTQLSQDCAFKVAGDGEIRCLPTNVAAHGRFYIDDQCSQPAVAQPKNACVQAPYAAKEDTSVCPARTTITSLGTPLADGATYYYQAGPGAPCEARTAGAVGTTIYPVGAEVAATDFVKATIAKTTGAPGLDLQRLDADDGAKAFWSFEDTAKSTACGFLRANDDSMRCLPKERSNAGAGIFWSSDCTVQVPIAIDSLPASCPAPAYATSASGGSGNNAKYAMYASGAAHTDPIFTKGTSTCTEYPAATYGVRTFDLGAAVMPGAFVQASEVDGAARGRLLEKLLDVGGKVKQRTAFYDTLLKGTCTMSAQSATDGSLRCLPDNNFAIVSTYSASCNGPPLVHTYQPGTPVFAHNTLSQNQLCPPRRKVYRVGAAYSGQLYVGCSLLTKPSEVYATGIKFFRLGTEVTPAEMVAVTEELR